LLTLLIQFVNISIFIKKKKLQVKIISISVQMINAV